MVSGKYKLRILWALKGGWKRYAEIKRGLLTGSIGTAEIAPRVLSRELRTLVAMGMVERKDHQIFPLKVEYKLIRKGRTFLPIIAVIHKWGMRHLMDVHEGAVRSQPNRNGMANPASAPVTRAILPFNACSSEPPLRCL